MIQEHWPEKIWGRKFHAVKFAATFPLRVTKGKLSRQSIRLAIQEALSNPKGK